MPIIEGPERGHRLHLSISTDRQVAAGWRARSLPTRRICRNRRGRIKRACKISDGGARVNRFEYFFGADMGMATVHYGHRTQCTAILSCMHISPRKRRR